MGYFRVWYTLFNASGKHQSGSDEWELDSDEFMFTEGDTTRDELVAEIQHNIGCFSTSATKDYPWIVSDANTLHVLAKSIAVKSTALSKMDEGWTVTFSSEFVEQFYN